MNHPLAPEPILRAALRVLHVAGYTTRNWTLDETVPREQVHALWEAIHEIPDLIQRWQGHASLHELQRYLREYDGRWSAPKLETIFDQALTAQIEQSALLEEIRQVFGRVRRGLGVTLHETEVIDNYGSEKERNHARRKDTDRHWWEVRDEWIDSFGGIGGLSFLDDAGFRYYLPAYMSYWLRTGNEPNSVAFHLHPRGNRNFDTIFLPAERKTVAKFLNYARRQLGSSSATEALHGYWEAFADETDDK